ncbi:TraB/GumN family protein [Cohnella nanjingensis]|uniref:TraB/GumN family protein n=1 Tax=Cohnella nanjingensis TaxID=1387779 RepID=A0A7X0RNM0_9BACL|nr:TraB/GumN family protein [Cohnella nanjingensis]MBB6670842.1 TraB/GumN family protein [Cohnella nanjingensis]
MKKMSVLLLPLFLLTSVFSSVHAADKALSVWLNGEQLQFGKSAPIVEKGVTLVPMRSLLEKLGVKVSWNQATRTVSGAKEGLSLSLQMGSTKATANGKTVKLDAAPKQIRNVTYVPLRFVSETTGYQVDWNPSLRQVHLTSKQQSEGSRGFLWKVENKGNTVYLLASIHHVPEGMYPLRPEIENAFQAAQYLGVEVDMSTVTPEQLQKQVLELGVYQDGTKLKDHISAETYKKATAFLKAKGMPENSFDPFKPWFATQQIMNLQVAQEGYHPEAGIDNYLIEKANKAKKPIISLETMESQMQMNNNFSDALQERLMLQNLDPKSVTPPSPDVGIDYLNQIWIEGDDQDLLEFTKPTGWDAEYYKGLVSDRNVGMAEKIKGYLNGDKKDTYMVVVGMLHMLSDQGVVSLLEKEGFTVERQ